ncbi:phosphatase PAP2 family protein [Phenylobacterium sp.]|uniref:phosphatase PAP2 family protein n=1 Tax=Phenylobacterium sp. TaxID=1871053 RepID=UPI002734349F|nr:phosphatase PAP2 family protein [Phenylobacterium sp.]MDP3659197.1 phosphatase PAP2 family protein [Phenylobacterium sp.]
MVVFERDLSAEASRRLDEAWLKRFSAALHADRGFYVAIAAYVTAGFAFAALARRELHFDGAYFRVWVQLIVSALALSLTIGLCGALVRGSARGRWEAAGKAVRHSLRPEIAAGLLLFAGLGLFTAAFTAIKCMLPHARPFWADALLADFDRALFFGRDPWLWLQPLLGSYPVTSVVEFIYGPVWISMMLLAPLFAAAFMRRGALRNQFLAAYLLAWSVNGTLVAGLMMSAGPAFFAQVTGDAARFGQLVSYLQYNLDWSMSASAGQHMLWNLYQHQLSSLGAGISAFPSMHMSMTTLCVLAAWRLDRRAGWAMLAFALVITAGSIHLAWHYAADGLFAIVSSVCLWKLAGWATRGADAREGGSAPRA